MIRGVLFDLDNTLLDFMRMKRASIEAAAAAMVDAGLPMPWEEVYKEIYSSTARWGSSIRRSSTSG